MKLPPVVAPVLMLAALCPALAQNGKPDSEGFIRDWLVLAPAPIGEYSGAEEINRKQFAEEASPSAREGAKQKVGEQELAWQRVASKQFYLDFRALHPTRFEHVVAWAVAYVVSPDDKSGLTLLLNSNDQGKVYLNGQEVAKFSETRTLEKEAEDKAGDIALKKGVNVVVLKVINEENNWQGSVRFTDKAGKPVTDLTIETKP